MSWLARAGRSRSAWAPACVLAVVAAFSLSYLREWVRSPVPGGWDGVPQFAIADLYAHQLFPRLSGWLPEYFAGMPFPDFYPPLFYLLVGALTRLGFTTAHAFHIVTASSVLLLAPLVAAAARRLARSDLGGLAAGLVAAAFVLSGRSASSLGGTLHATFALGLSTHALGLDLLLAATCFLVGVPRRRRDRALAGLCLGLVPLANVHVAWDALLLMAGITCARFAFATGPRAGLRIVLAHAGVGVLAALIALAWLLPMITRLAYVPTKALDPVLPGAVLRSYLHHFVYVAAAGYVGWRRREPFVVGLAVTLAAILGFAMLPLHELAPGLSIQPWRVLAAFEPLAAILVGFLVARLGTVTRPLVRVAIAVGVGAAFLSRARPLAQPEGILSADTLAAFARGTEALPRALPGRVLVEMGTGRGGGFAMQALSGAAGGAAITTVFREASIASLFAIPLRNAFSAHGERFGIDSKIDPARVAYRDGLTGDDLARLRLFGVTSILAGSASMNARLEREPRLTPLGPPGEWRLYGLSSAPPLAEVPVRGPVLTFTGWSVKPRPDDGWDFVRLGEEAFASGWLDAPLALARTGRLDEEPLDDFPAVLVVDYRAGDPERAIARLREFAARGGALVLRPGDSPIFRALAAQAGGRVRVVSAKEIGAVFATLDELLPKRGQVAVAAARFGHGTAEIAFAQPPGARVPVYVKQTWFPDWRADAGPLYLASPTFQLFFTDRQKTRLERVPGAAQVVGALGSAAGLMAVLALAWRSRARSIGQPRSGKRRSA